MLKYLLTVIDLEITFNFMEIPKKFLQDKTVLLLVTLIALLLVIGVSVVLLRFDVSKNPTTVVAYRPNISGASYQSGKPIDIYSMAAYIFITAVLGVFLSARIYKVRQAVSVFLLASTALLLVLATIVANSLISLQ
jgi:phosphate starvation-inducible membrane PsiE